jgi:hypothetical protein
MGKLERALRFSFSKSIQSMHSLTPNWEKELLARWAMLVKQHPLVTYHSAVQKIDKHNIAAAKWYLDDYQKFIELSREKRQFERIMSFPILTDRNSPSGSMSGHYFHMDLFVAQRIFKKKPLKHVDIGSRQDGFVAHVASFREIEVFDIRPQRIKVENVTFRRTNFMRFDKSLEGYCDSVSSLHAIEHFGLGRYGEPIDPQGHIKAIDNVHTMLQDGGSFYLAVPIGQQRVEFNAHRVFDVAYLVDLFNGRFEVVAFSYVDDKGDLHKNAVLTTHRCHYGCGILELRKI